jgi:U3 small nucleolar RNA-associated protein 24
MGKAKQTRKFAVTKKIISPKDTRVRQNAEKAKQSALFFQYNSQLGPPYNVLVDTNFINFSIR